MEAAFHQICNRYEVRQGEDADMKIRQKNIEEKVRKQFLIVLKTPKGELALS